MPGLPMLDLVLGMVFLYLLLSLVCTAVVEWVSNLRQKRAQVLAEGIRELLADPPAELVDRQSASPQAFYRHPLIQALYRSTGSGNVTDARAKADDARATGAGTTAGAAVAVRRDAGAKARAAGNLPSYIPARTFALALLDLLAPVAVDGVVVQPASRGDLASQQAARMAHAADTAIARMRDVVDAVQKLPPDSYLGRTLRVLIADARGDLTLLQENLEVWYNHAMDRVSGWYKRWTQTVLFALALGVAVVTNADTLAIAHRLSSDAALRQAIAAQAEAYAKKPDAGKPQADSSIAAVHAAVDALNGVGLPLGWTAAEVRSLGLCRLRFVDCPRAAATAGASLEAASVEPGSGNAAAAWMLKIAGLLVTAFAVSLGAPFWFDMLNKVVTIRAAGRSPDEKPKSPEGGPKRPKEEPRQ